MIMRPERRDPAEPGQGQGLVDDLRRGVSELVRAEVVADHHVADAGPGQVRGAGRGPAGRTRSPVSAVSRKTCDPAPPYGTRPRSAQGEVASGSSGSSIGSPQVNCPCASAGHDQRGLVRASARPGKRPPGTSSRARW